MADPILHIKDGYFFEVPKKLVASCTGKSVVGSARIS